MYQINVLNASTVFEKIRLLSRELADVSTRRLEALRQGNIRAHARLSVETAEINISLESLKVELM